MTTEIMITVPESGSVIDVPLNRLKKSPNNVRKTPHTEAALEALAASIAAKGLLQSPVVEPERDGGGAPTGFWLVTIGEGRRLALLLLAKRKEIKKTEPIPCRVDVTHDAREISLDENVTRSAMHPADQFEAFRDLADRLGWSAETIGQRFGVSSQLVRQRLRLGAVSPILMARYREGDLTLDQLMAFAVSEDHARQEQVLEGLSWNRSVHAIRSAMMEQHVRASDRRARFVGLDAYAEAGGHILRDLFTEDGGGWLEDVSLLDRLAHDKLAALAETLRTSEGWAWAESGLDYPHANGWGRVYPGAVERSDEDQAAILALGTEYDALISAQDDETETSDDVAARLSEIEAALAAFGEDFAYTDEDRARGGLFVYLAPDGEPRIERGFVRPEDDRSEAEQADEAALDDPDPEEVGSDAIAPLPERLVADLTAYRTLGLAERLAASPQVALAAVVHSLVLRAFYMGHPAASCLDLRLITVPLGNHAPAIMDSMGGRARAERHESWAARLPAAVEDSWAFVAGLPLDDLLALLAHLASLSVNAVQTWERRPKVMDHADTLARAVSLDMADYWSPTTGSYLGRVTKARILQAVEDALSPAAAQRLASLKKGDMAEAAEVALAQTRWLPSVLRPPQPPEGDQPEA